MIRRGDSSARAGIRRTAKKRKSFYTYKAAVFLLTLLIGEYGTAQVVDNTSSFTNSGNQKYFRLHYDNDFFTKTDEYYTQGITLEVVHPALERFLFSRLLVKPKQSEIRYGIRIDHFGYTPTNIRSHEILYGDRPFCGNLTLTTFLVATDSGRQRRISTAFIMGIMGPGAWGKEMQTGVHRFNKNVQPLGWEYQIQNDVIIDYRVSYEKKLWEYHNVLLVNSAAELRLGTHTDKLTGGLNFMAGNYNDPYQPAVPSKQGRKKIAYYLYGQVLAGFTGYEASLEGGLFNHKSSYTISSENMTRVTLQGDYGVVISFRKIYLAYCQSVLTKEFRTGHMHRWGGFRIGVGL
jgi:lipid A 3-O-deacylase